MRKWGLFGLFLLMGCGLFSQGIEVPPDSVQFGITDVKPLFGSQSPWFDLNFDVDEFDAWFQPFLLRLPPLFTSDTHKRDVWIRLYLEPEGKSTIRLDARPEYSEADNIRLLQIIDRFPLLRPRYSACAMTIALRINGGVIDDLTEVSAENPELDVAQELASLPMKQQREFIESWARKDGWKMTERARRLILSQHPEYPAFEKFLKHHWKDRDILEELDHNPDYWALAGREGGSLITLTRFMLMAGRGQLSYAFYSMQLAFPEIAADNNDYSRVLLNRLYTYVSTYKSVQQQYYLQLDRLLNSRSILLMARAHDARDEQLQILDQIDMLNTLEPGPKLEKQLQKMAVVLHEMSPFNKTPILDKKAAFWDEELNGPEWVKVSTDSFAVAMRHMSLALMQCDEYGVAGTLLNTSWKRYGIPEDSLLYNYCLYRLNTLKNPDSLMVKRGEAEVAALYDASATAYFEAHYPAAALRDYRIGRYLEDIGLLQQAKFYLNRAIAANIPMAWFARSRMGNDSKTGLVSPDLIHFIALADSLTEDDRYFMRDDFGAAYAYIASCAYKKEDYTSCQENITRAISYDQQDKYLRLRALCSSVQEKYPEALDDMNTLMRGKSPEYQDYIIRGGLESELGYYGAALNDYQSAHTLKPEEAEPLLDMAAQFIRLKNYDQVNQTLDSLIVLNPAQAPVYQFQLGMEYWQNKDYGRGADEFRSLCHRFPYNADYRHMYASSLRGLGQLDQALIQCDSTLAADSKYENAYALKADMLISLGRTDEGLAVYDVAVHGGCSHNQGVILSYAEALIIAGHLDKAREILSLSHDQEAEPAAVAVRGFLELVQKALTGEDYSADLSTWRNGLNIDPDPAWWSFSSFDVWCPQAQINDSTRSLIQSWEAELARALGIRR